MKQQISAELKQGIVRRWYLYILPFALGAVSTAAFLNRYALLEAWTGELPKASFGDCFAYIFRGMQEYIPDQHQPFEVPVLFLLINILLAVLIGGYAAGELHGTGLNKLVRCQRRSGWWLCKCIWNVVSVLGYYAALIAGAVTAAFIASVKPGGAAFGKRAHCDFCLRDRQPLFFHRHSRSIARGGNQRRHHLQGDHGGRRV